MFDDIDKTVETLLKRNLPSSLGRSVNISFDTPDSQFPPAWIKLPAINLFLYDARENLDLRVSEWLWERQTDDAGIVKKPRAQIECSYIITAWTSESTPNHMLEEHRLLGEVMRALLKERTYPKDVLQGIFRNGSADILKSIALQADHLQMGEFWQAMGGKPRMAINYQITASIDVRAPEETKATKDKSAKIFDPREAKNN